MPLLFKFVQTINSQYVSVSFTNNVGCQLVWTQHCDKINSICTIMKQIMLVFSYLLWNKSNPDSSNEWANIQIKKNLSSEWDLK